MEKAVGMGQWTQAEQFLTPDFYYRVGARTATRGIPAFRAYMEVQFSVVDWLGHTTHLEALTSSPENGDTVIIEVTSHFRRKSDQVEFDLPCTDIYRFDGDRVCDWRVYSDIQVLGLPNEEENADE